MVIILGEYRTCVTYPYPPNSISKNSQGRNQQPIVDGQLFSVKGARPCAVHSPGHSHNYMCFVLEEDNAMFTGDNILGYRTAANEHLNTWMESLRVMSMHNCTIQIMEWSLRVNPKASDPDIFPIWLLQMADIKACEEATCKPRSPMYYWSEHRIEVGCLRDGCAAFRACQQVRCIDDTAIKNTRPDSFQDQNNKDCSEINIYIYIYIYMRLCACV